MERPNKDLIIGSIFSALMIGMYASGFCYMIGHEDKALPVGLIVWVFTAFAWLTKGGDDLGNGHSID
jgi:hypothetical protein